MRSLFGEIEAKQYHLNNLGNMRVVSCILYEMYQLLVLSGKGLVSVCVWAA